MYLLISGSSRPWGFLVSRSGVGLSVASAARARGQGGAGQGRAGEVNSGGQVGG